MGKGAFLHRERGKGSVEGFLLILENTGRSYVSGFKCFLTLFFRGSGSREHYCRCHLSFTSMGHRRALWCCEVLKKIL